MCKSTAIISKHDPPLLLKVAAYVSGNFVILVAVASSLALLLGPFLYPKTIGLYFLFPYCSYTYFQGRHELKDGNPWPAFSKKFPLFCVLRNYLDLKFHQPLPKELIEAERSSDAQFIFSVFPHGVNADYRILMDGMQDTVLPNVADKIRVLSASILFRIPIIREICLWTGCVDARWSVAQSLLRSGKSFVVLPGGMDEQLMTDFGKEKVYLSKRKGFIKLSMKENVPVVPMYVFGCSDMYYTSSAFFRLRFWIMKSFGACIPLSMGWMASVACPLPVKTTIVFGKPLLFQMKDQGSPSDIEVEVAHSTFVDKLISLFNEHKGRLGYGNRELEVV